MTHRTKPARRGRLLSALAAGACALGILAGAATEANAYTYWNGDVASSGRKPSGSAYDLRSSITWTAEVHKANAGAHYPGGTSLYANWAEGWGFACHPYAAGQTLGAMLRNPHTVTISVLGDVRFNVNAC